MKSLFLLNPNQGGSNSTAIYAQKLGHRLYYCNRKRKAIVLDHEVSKWDQCCVLMRLKQQPKQSLDSSYNFHAGWPPSVLPCPPRHLSRHPQSLSVYTISGAEWSAAQGSPWEAVEAPPYPASNSPPTLYARQPPPTTSPPPHVVHSHWRSFSSNINQIHARVFFSWLLIYGRYRGLCGYITPTLRHYQLFSGGPEDWFCQQL